VLLVLNDSCDGWCPAAVLGYVTFPRASWFDQTDMCTLDRRHRGVTGTDNHAAFGSSPVLWFDHCSAEYKQLSKNLQCEPCCGL